ncbi:uncharacterized protein LOC143984946 [Lithobates pipiens]
MSGCELRDDGTTEGYFQFGYDGRDFVYLDTQRGIYIPTMNEAQISTQRWNSPEERWGEREKNYLENLCIPYLKRSIEYGRGDLERRGEMGRIWKKGERVSCATLLALVLVNLLCTTLAQNHHGHSHGDVHHGHSHEGHHGHSYGRAHCHEHGHAHGHKDHHGHDHHGHGHDDLDAFRTCWQFGDALPQEAA